MAIQKCKDLEVYNLSIEAAVSVHNETKKFPREEQYSLIDQMRRSSRSISANIREGFVKRKYPDVFVRHLNDALGSAEETLCWLDFSDRFGYLLKEKHEELSKKYKQVCSMLYKLMQNWEKF